jgi:hypothetical protein
VPSVGPSVAAVDRGRSPEEPAAEPFVHITQSAAGPPTPDQKFEEAAVYNIPYSNQYFVASKLPESGTWFLTPETGRPGRAYKVLKGGSLEVTWESAGYPGTLAVTIDEFDKVANEDAWCAECQNDILPEHEPYCDPEPPSVDEAYEWMLTEKYT